MGRERARFLGVWEVWGKDSGGMSGGFRAFSPGFPVGGEGPAGLWTERPGGDTLEMS